MPSLLFPSSFNQRTFTRSLLGLSLLGLTQISFAEQQAVPQIAADYVNDGILPPIIQWHGASEALMKSADHPWVTEFELSGGKVSPDYEATMAWLNKLVEHSPMLNKVSLGTSPQGREIWMVIATKEGVATPIELKQHRKPTVLIQAGIHSGEIDGKDAGMMLLRDMVTGDKGTLLEHANLLFVPIFSVDGHERQSDTNRVNQRGPVDMGWRTTSTNLNLNRDYAKADTPEMQHMLRAINIWQPDLYIDVHVTDGIDYQYDVTYGYNVKQGLSPASFDWLEKRWRPAVDQALTQAGHVPGSLVFALDKTDISKGMSYWNPSPRFSNGYGDARHLPTVLIENHSLKPYKQRVLGTYVMMEQTLKTLADETVSLRAAIHKDKYAYPDRVTLAWESETQAFTWDFKGIDYRLETSPISGAEVVRWTGKPRLYEALPLEGKTKPAISVSRPAAYYIPAQWQEVIDRLEIHGIRMTRLETPTQVRAEQYQLTNPEFDDKDYEGRQRVKTDISKQFVTETLPAGTVKIDTKQPLGDLAILLLEPQSPDSLLQWGLFNPIFTRTEYIEDYAVEPMAAQMLANDAGLKAEFEAKLEQDEAFKADPKARLRWFYERSPYFDSEYQVYPVLRAL
ncbi:M14 family metallopeptidase [Shewanella submarina]|uniref:M14 family metallopeptidase n=1 Tax=Shewanella submarina TaxID=2016376 RepID=A0ABV7GGG1_9GAMM|nr:M14 family metallopeptidase [Shewanella submarina]MCL1039568.1 M14 family metallopeptidase [Shewanella submarina]